MIGCLTWEPGQGWRGTPLPMVEVSMPGGLGAWARGVDAPAVPTPGPEAQAAWGRILAAVRPIPLHVVPRLLVAVPGGPWRAVAGASCGGVVLLSAEAMAANAILDPGGETLLLHELGHELWHGLLPAERATWEAHGDRHRAVLLAALQAGNPLLAHDLSGREAEASTFARWAARRPGGYDLAPNADCQALWESLVGSLHRP